MVRTLALVLFALAGLTATAHAQPSVPAMFYGTAAIDGRSVAEGTAVRALVDGKDCSQMPAKGTVLDQGVSVYAVSVMHESQEAGCGRAGKTVTFTVGGRVAVQQAEWKDGVHQLDLNVGTGTTLPLPQATAVAPESAAATRTAAAKFQAAPAGSALPTDDPGIRPPGGEIAGEGEDAAGESGSRILGMVIVVLGGIAAVGAGVGAWLAHKRSPG
ncbi:MAG: hypothetical protein HY875_07455 [Chloroflexi bacterium]|nr:hypothetical protein [Chloroflexota bacterium]